MELDLLDFTEKPIEDHCRDIQQINDKKNKDFRGTLMATIFLPKHQ
jgi:hypothetical protein